jgi:hypothetical protein
MEIDALEQLISEDVKVQGQSCMLVSKLSSWSIESSPELLLESSPELLSESSPEEMRSTSTTLLPGSSLEESSLTSMCVDRFFLRVEEKTLPLHGRRRWSLPTWPLHVCTASSLGRRRTGLFHGEPRKMHEGGTLGWLLFITAEPHSLGGGGGQHRGRRTGMWPWGLLAEPPPKVTGNTFDGDDATTETRKVKAEEGDRRRKVGQSIY